MFNRCRFKMLAAALICLVGASGGQAQVDPAAAGVFEHFLTYSRSVIAGDHAAARACWHPDDLAAAARLGLAYAGEAPKVDLDSPLWTHVQAIRDTVFGHRFGPPTILQSGPFAGHASLMLVVDPRGPNRATKQYLLEPDGQGGWLLARHERLLAERGPATAGRFVTVFERRTGAPWTLPEHLLTDLDAAVAEMAARLGYTTRRLDDLERAQLHYLLADPPTVDYVAGARTVGVAMLPTDMVVTSHPHHAHELAHLLVNSWLEGPPLFTLPLLQEGLAVNLGGRWGRHSRVLDRIGRKLLLAGDPTIDQMLTRDAFHALGPDMTYAPAGVFAGFLLDAFGPGGLRAAYLAASGSLTEVAAWSSDEVKQRLATALQVSWDDLAARFAASLDDGSVPGLQPVDGDWLAAARVREGPQQHSQGLRARLLQHEGAAGVLVDADRGPAAAALLFGGGDPEAQPNPLFAEHFPGATYRGETHALILTPAEARLYDYRRQILLELHSEGFWPSDGTGRPYARDGGRELAVTVAPGLLPVGEDWVLVGVD